MSLRVIGRKEEQKALQEVYNSKHPEFIAIYGRRRVGKTFLIKKFFEMKNCIFFNITGIQNGKLTEQIKRFTIEIGRAFYKGTQLKEKNDWYETFDVLTEAINKFVPKNQKVVLFFDEFP